MIKLKYRLKKNNNELKIETNDELKIETNDDCVLHQVVSIPEVASNFSMLILSICWNIYRNIP